MRETKIAFIGRAANFSPHSANKDAAILAAVRNILAERGFHCCGMVGEDCLTGLGEADAYVSMGRCQHTLDLLGDRERHGRVVINSTAAVRKCKQRSLLMAALDGTDVKVPSLKGDDGYWVKRGDSWAETPDDVQFAPDAETARGVSRQMLERGATKVDVRAHVVGDLVKFYAVSGTGFFRYYYPGDDGDWKFCDEARNGRPHHYLFDARRMQAMVQQAADYATLDVYGGDCIVRPDGQPVLIDLNDWPSFSRCREEAAQAIAARIEQQMGETDGKEML